LFSVVPVVLAVIVLVAPWYPIVISSQSVQPTVYNYTVTQTTQIGPTEYEVTCESSPPAVTCPAPQYVSLDPLSYKDLATYQLTKGWSIVVYAAADSGCLETTNCVLSIYENSGDGVGVFDTVLQSGIQGGSFIVPYTGDYTVRVLNYDSSMHTFSDIRLLIWEPTAQPIIENGMFSANITEYGVQNVPPYQAVPLGVTAAILGTSVIPLACVCYIKLRSTKKPAGRRKKTVASQIVL